MKKILAVSIILLFLGVAVAPSINHSVVTASQENDLVEVTSQACGITGYKDTTVKLTREQYQDLEQYLVEFRAKLNQTTTREEAVPLFKEAVVELDKYGLLPRGMSVERAQRLVLRRYQNAISTLGSNNNSNCLITGKATYCYVVGAIYTKLLMNQIINEGGIHLLMYILWSIFSVVLFCIIPITLLGTICFGSCAEGSSHGEPSYGEIKSVDFSGNSYTLIGEFYGGLGFFFKPNFAIPVNAYNLIGVLGFSGIQFYSTSTQFKHFIGSCVKLNVSSETPSF
ncbi:MAG: hypothetical protein JW840_03445 [Candidatus Thermoplasmatota archaeon]|nr:hypothetical protein [Candidatus Thermoplasmatota archaeon]